MEPRPVSGNLWAQEVSARAEMVRNWSAVQDWLGEMLIAIGKPEEGAPLLKEAKEHGVFGESGGRGRD